MGGLSGACLVLLYGLSCLGHSRAHNDEHVAAEDGEKRAFGSLTKPLDERNLQRLFLSQRPRPNRHAPVDMKRDQDQYHLGAQFPPASEGYYGDLDLDDDDLDLEEEQPYTREEFDDEDDEDIEKRPFGATGGVIGKRALGLDAEKRPFGSLTGYMRKRPFGSLTGRYKRPMPIWGKIGKRPSMPIWGKIGKRPAMPMWGGKVGKRRMPMWGTIGKRSGPRWGDVIRPSGSEDAVDKRYGYSMWGHVGKRALDKRPFGPMTSIIG